MDVGKSNLIIFNLFVHFKWSRNLTYLKSKIYGSFVYPAALGLWKCSVNENLALEQIWCRACHPEVEREAYDHIIRPDDNSLGAIGLNIQVDRKRPQAAQKNGDSVRCFKKPWILFGHSIRVREVTKPNRTSRPRYRTETVIVEINGVIWRSIWLIAVSAVIEMLLSCKFSASCPVSASILPPNYLV